LVTVPITAVFETYLRSLASVFANRPADVTEENIQARIRGNYLMALSNKFGSMVLSTGNKSEIAVGYCTLYGDMAGGLAVISDVPKLMVYELARWINRERELIPRSTIEKPPSAELRPNQKDEDSLPPYDVLDRILKAYIEDLRSPQEIADHYGFDLKMVRDIALLVDRSEYKRKQAAPGLKINSRICSLGRRHAGSAGHLAKRESRLECSTASTEEHRSLSSKPLRLRTRCAALGRRLQGHCRRRDS
jgi:NAD+ synthetase